MDFVSKISRVWLFLGVLLLAVGGMIYVLFRSTGLLFFIVLDHADLMRPVDSLRSSVARAAAPDFVVYSLPSLLWSLSYIMLVQHLYGQESLRTRMRWASVIPLAGVASELMQLLAWLPGTFDVRDLLCYSIPLVVYYVISRFTIKNNRA